MQRMVNEEYTKGKEKNQQSNEVRRMENFLGDWKHFDEQRGGGLIGTQIKEEKGNKTECDK